MKKVINTVENEGFMLLFVLMGILLIIFPMTITKFVPYMLGVALILRGIICILVVINKHDKASDVKPGDTVLYFVLGGAILYHNAEAIGPIGAIWAMMSLNEVSEEITEFFEEGGFSGWRDIIRVVFGVITVGLAVALMFDPFEHFTVHVRVLGLEMISSCFVRKHTLLMEKREGTAA